VLKLHIDGGERAEIYIFIHDDIKVHGENETEPSKDRSARLFYNG
jgi:hypothetical protein